MRKKTNSPKKKLGEPKELKELEKVLSIREQFDIHGSCKICNDSGFFETNNSKFVCSCSQKRDESFQKMKHDIKEFGREMIDEIMREEFGMTRKDIRNLKKNIAIQKKEVRDMGKKFDDLKKNMITLPVEGSKKTLIYDETSFEKNIGYCIFIYNNNTTQLKDVVSVLVEKCDMSEKQAGVVAMHISEKGSAVVKVTQDEEDAEDVCRTFRGFNIQAEYIKH